MDDDCNCAFVGPDPAQIRALIDNGDVPLIYASMKGRTIQLEVQRAAFDVPYIAISHVWSGGLGNQKSLSLPTCQLQRIHSLLKPLAQRPPRKNETGWHKIFKMNLSSSEKDAE